MNVEVIKEFPIQKFGEGYKATNLPVYINALKEKKQPLMILNRQDHSYLEVIL